MKKSVGEIRTLLCKFKAPPSDDTEPTPIESVRFQRLICVER
jgi:hypothetical protein